MVHPLLPATALFAQALPAGASLLSQVGSMFGSLFGGGATPLPAEGLRVDEGLLTQILLDDPELRASLQKEVDRRLGDEIPEDPETRLRLERLRELLRRLDAADLAAPPEARPAPTGLTPAESKPAQAPAALRPLALLDVPPPLLSASAAMPPPAAAVPPAAAAPLKAVEAIPVPAPAPAASSESRTPAALSGAASADLAERVLRAAQLTQSRGVARLRLVLTPPELGELHLDLSVRGKVLHAAIEADRPSAAEALLAQWPSLRGALEAQGFEIGGFSVSADGGFAREGELGGSGAPPAAAAADVAEEPAAAPAPSARPQILDLKA